jgi:hypothetical protein
MDDALYIVYDELIELLRYKYTLFSRVELDIL